MKVLRFDTGTVSPMKEHISEGCSAAQLHHIT